MSSDPHRTLNWRAWGRRLEALLIVAGLGAAGASVHATYRDALTVERTLPGLTLAGKDIGGLTWDELRSKAEDAAERQRQRTITLIAGDAKVATTAVELGASVRLGDALTQAMALGRSGELGQDLTSRFAAYRGRIDLKLGSVFDADVALETLESVAPAIERPSLPTRLDMEARKVLPAEPGATVLAYDSLSAVATELASGSDRIELRVQAKPPVEDPLAEIADELDISIVLGQFSTPYQNTSNQADRNHNLKIGATAIDGYVLRPGQTFSFNEVVGERSAAAGYRYATGIAAGQLIDVLGGGICQVSTTLFGAAFFGGLDIVSARPHSRPSSYVDMGLDSVVAWPELDMKIRNPYDFPLVLHMTVLQGQVQAQVLGPQRPYQVAFERTLGDVVEYPTVWRDDETLQQGAEEVVQRGRRGFSLTRERKFYAAGDEVKNESWTLRYPPTTEILRRGTNPGGREPKPGSRAPLRDPAASMRITQ